MTKRTLHVLMAALGMIRGYAEPVKKAVAV